MLVIGVAAWRCTFCMYLGTRLYWLVPISTIKWLSRSRVRFRVPPISSTYRDRCPTAFKITSRMGVHSVPWNIY